MEKFTNIETYIILGWNILILVIAVALARVLQWLMVRAFSSQHIVNADLTKCLIEKANRPFGYLLMSFTIYAFISLAKFDDLWIDRIHTILKPLSVAILGWLVVNIATAIGQWYEKRNLAHARELDSRRAATQIHILMRVIIGVIIIITIIGMAMVIPTLREFGMSLFASAGIAGIIVGVAAKESLSNIIAGVQLAFTRQILLGDEVVIKDEFGTIEEITSSYVVVKIWDLRRMVIPLQYFMANPFENWTYNVPDIIGTVSLYTDYNVNIEGLRTEAIRLAKESGLWDGKRCQLVVTDNNSDNVELQVSVSAKNSHDLWKLRCYLREKLISYLQETQPASLPKTRVMLEKER